MELALGIYYWKKMTNDKSKRKIQDLMFPRFPNGRRKVNSKLADRIHQFLVRDLDQAQNVWLNVYYANTDIFGGDWE